MRAIALMMVAALLTGCGHAPALGVTAAWVRLAAVPANPAAGYFTIRGGPADATLISVTSPMAIRAEMHEDMGGAMGSMTGMRPIAGVPVPAGGTVAFAPGKRHVMLYDVNPAVKPGGSMPLLFVFASGERIQVDARAVGAADPAPAP